MLIANYPYAALTVVQTSKASLHQLISNQLFLGGNYLDIPKADLQLRLVNTFHQRFTPLQHALNTQELYENPPKKGRIKQADHLNLIANFEE